MSDRSCWFRGPATPAGGVRCPVEGVHPLAADGADRRPQPGPWSFGPLRRGAVRRMVLAPLASLASLASLGLVFGPTPASAQGEPAEPAPHVQTIDPDAVMPLEDVRKGMRGYGMTVFHGVEPEPFDIEVLSIVHHAGPQRSVIWVHSTDERMLESGPVQGMSGSPIYLWDEGESGQIGEGGRLVGAFAYGFALSKGCIIGVQPIEYMLEIGDRARSQANDADEVVTAPAPGDVATGQRTLAQLAQLAGQYARPGYEAAPRLDAMRALLDPSRVEGAESGFRGSESELAVADAGRPLPRAPESLRDQGQVVEMLLPMAVGSSELAALTRPLLSPLGIEPVAASQMAGNAPTPHGIDREAVHLGPGSVMAIPLAMGDLDLAASGTVTGVLEDGTVLALGHGMYAEGPAALPMATGHVHFVVPRIDLSFKLSGSLDIRGSLVRDEVLGVIGRSGAEQFATAPVNVNVKMPGQAARTYTYQVVDHRQLTPIIAAIVAMRSVTALHQPPPESTLSLSGEIHFNGGRTIEIGSMMPGEQMFAMISEILPPIEVLMRNPHEALKLESMDITAEITPGQRTAQIVNAQLDRAEVAPGERVGVTVWVQPHKQPIQRLRTHIDVPAHVPEGDYPMMISDARTYLAQLMSMRPHLFTTRNVDELTRMVQRVMSVRPDSLYVTTHLPEEGIAVGRQELSQLPSSRRAMIFTPTSTVARPYAEMLVHSMDTDLALSGRLAFTLHVREDRARVQAAGER